MGRTDQIFENPAIKVLKWKVARPEKKSKGTVIKEARSAGFYYYDKEKEEDILVNMPISGTWLETAHSVTGFSKSMDKGIYSNAVRDLKETELTVKCGDRVIAKGLYSDIKDKVKADGGKYCQDVYFLINGEVWRILFYGVGFKTWGNFFKRSTAKNNDVVAYDTTIVETELGEYEAPLFKWIPTTQEDANVANKVYDDEIKPYFEYIEMKPSDDKIAKEKVVIDKEEVNNVEYIQQEEEDAPF